MYLFLLKTWLITEGAEETCLVGAVYERLIVVVKAFISKVSENDAKSCNPQTLKMSRFALAERNLARATAKGLGVTPTKHRGRSCRRHKIFDHRNKWSVVDIVASFCVRRKHLLGTVMDERLDQNEDNRYRPTSAVQVCVVQD